MAKLTALKDKHALEEEEQELNKQREQLRKRKETLELKSELDATTAKLIVFNTMETQIKTPTTDGMNEYYEEMEKSQKMSEKENGHTTRKPVHRNTGEMQSVRPKEGPQYNFSPYHSAQEQPKALLHHSTQEQPKASQGQYDDTQADKPFYTGNFKETKSRWTPQEDSGTPSTQVKLVQDKTLYSILQRQNDITASLVTQQHCSSLPQKDVKVFEGDPVEYRSFLQAFEHAIEAKTVCGKDRLYYLEQYTRGQCRELLRTCMWIQIGTMLKLKNFSMSTTAMSSRLLAHI